jgi:hypothetical protein
MTADWGGGDLFVADSEAGRRGWAVNQRQRLTILGDRQAGKSHTLRILSITEAMQGRTVLYETEPYAGQAYAEETARQIDDLLTEWSIIHHRDGGNGQRRFTLDKQGGSILIKPQGQPLRGRFDPPLDTHILDDCGGEGDQRATRVYRGMLR